MEAHHWKPSLILMEGGSHFKGHLICSSGSACQCAPTWSRQFVSNVHQDFDLCCSASPTCDRPGLPCHHVANTQSDNSFKSNSKVSRELPKCKNISNLPKNLCVKNSTPEKQKAIYNQLLKLCYCNFYCSPQ